MSKVRELVTADLGGTHARFAIAEANGVQIARSHSFIKLKCADYPSLQMAWQAYGEILDRTLPDEAAIAVAGPVGGEVIQFTNSGWMLRPALVPEKLGAERFTIVNDFAAVAHASAQLSPEHFAHVCGPDKPLEAGDIVSVIGPGTGLGVAQLFIEEAGSRVVATEGAHTDFAPLDAFEDQLLASLRKRHIRVSTERVVCGSGLREIQTLLARQQEALMSALDDKELWRLALSGEDPLAAAALDRFCMCLGSAAGDIALVQGANKVVIAGGLGARIGDRLETSGFCQRFAHKGRYQAMMEAMSVYRLTYEEPGLYGAACAFLKEHSCP